MNHIELLQRMIEFDAGDPKRIQHFLKVYEFALLIGHSENLPPETQNILEVAAIVHDIGIHAAEEKYHGTAGKYQELEGQPLAVEMLKSLNYDESVIERVSYLVAHHHHYNQIDGLDYQILVEADFLVNAYEDSTSEKSICAFRDKIFKTDSGRRLLNTIYGLDGLDE